MLFPALAVVPLLSLLLLQQVKGAGRVWLRRHLLLAVSWFAWQVVLNGVLFASTDWIYWTRLLDALLIALLVTLALAQESAETATSTPTIGNSRKFLLSLLPILALHTGIQAISIYNHGEWNFLSLFMAIAFVFRLDRNYGRSSMQPKVRFRLLLLCWLAGVVLPLPIFRVALLLQVAWIFHRQVMDYVERLQATKREFHKERGVIKEIIEQLTGSIHDFSNLADSMQLYLSGLCGSLEAKAGAVYLWDSEKKAYHCIAVHGYYFPLQKAVDNIFTRQEALRDLALSNAITDPTHLVWKCGEGKEEIYIKYASQYQGIVGRAKGIQTLILEPLILDQELLGVLVLQNKLYERYFTESDAYLVRNFSHHATMILNASRLLGDKVERDRLQHELVLGTKIQADLLPRFVPHVDGVELAGSMTPAKEIGGDYYDFFQADGDRVAICIADVSGKGVPAGMIMSMLQTLLHAQYVHFSNTRDLLISINASLASKIRSSMFVTLLLFEWNTSSRTLRYTSCGHEHILHYRAAEKRLDCLKSGGLALGMTEDISTFIRERQLPVAPGDTVLLYTDGIIEARNPENDMYGLDRLKRFVESNQGLPAETIRQLLHEDLNRFRRERDQVDDITAIIMRF